MATVNGVSVSAFYGYKNYQGVQYGTMAFSQLQSIFPEVPPGGLRLCMALRNNPESCATPEQLCSGNTCVFSFFNTDRSCCPTDQVPFHPPPPPPFAVRAPPPPSLDPDFPFSSCTNRDITLTPYRLVGPYGPYNETSSTTTYCMSVTADGYVDDNTNVCAAMTPNKIEFVIGRWPE